MVYATEAERIEARRASRRKQYWGEDRPKTHYYPATRAPRVDRSTMTPEAWVEYRKRKQAERSARYNAKNPGLTNTKLRKRRAENPWYAPLLAAGDRSRQKGLDFDLTATWANDVYTGCCALTGIPFVISAQGSVGKPGGRPYSPSIDRINPLKGYTQDNCRFVLFAVNSFKGVMSDAEMYHVARALVAKAPE